MSTHLRESVFISLLLACASASASTFHFAINGHWYEAISKGNAITWVDAKSEAESLTHLGIPGHLATLTSHEENIFVWDKLSGIDLRNTLVRWFPVSRES